MSKNAGTKLIRLKFLLVCFVVFSLFFCASTAKACIPVGGTPPPCYVYWEADAVFAGEVSDMRKVPRQQGETFDKLLTRFVVVEVFRGVAEKEVDVATITGTECDMKIAKGEKWLVYAYRNAKTGRLEIGMRSTLFSHAAEDLQYIRSLPAGRSQSSITVRQPTQHQVREEQAPFAFSPSGLDVRQSVSKPLTSRAPVGYNR